MTTTPNADALSALLSETLRERAVSDERLKAWAGESLMVPTPETMRSICTELLALRAQMRWQPIESALIPPGEADTDGFKAVLAWDAQGDGAGPLWTRVGYKYVTAYPELFPHWLPLPPPPTQVSTPSSERG